VSGTLLSPELAAAAERVAAIAAAHADEVDRDARFPHEAAAALKAERLMGAAAPRSVGGLELGIAQIAEICQTLGRACASTGMAYAMHQIQVACLAHHGLGAPALRRYLAEMCDRQLLIASVTSEVGTGGDLRSSKCALEAEGDRFRFVKHSTTLSYGEQADDYLVTVRRDADAAPSDQVLVLVRRADAIVEKKGEWDTLGMRGTCSPPFSFTGTGPIGHVFADAFGDIAARTMVPYTHVLWAGAWVGLASDAVARASRFVRQAARKTPGSAPPGAMRLAEVASMLQAMRASVAYVTHEADRLIRAGDAGRDRLTSIGFALALNNLKTSCSRQMVEIVWHALGICGMAGYRNTGPFALGRHLRDAHSGALQVSNDRILLTNASMLLVHKDTPGL
jgi:acyl-CoA dehydrogenase